MLTIDRHKARLIIVEARKLSAKTEAGAQHAAAGMIGDEMIEALGATTEGVTENTHGPAPADYQVGMPLLGDYPADGLADGLRCDA